MAKLIMFTLSLLCFITSTITGATEYPQEVARITRGESTYLSPENSLRSLSSALYVCDLSWADSALTNDTLAKSIRDFNKLGISRSKKCALEQNIQTSYILARIVHLDAIILLVEGHGFDGTIEVIPHTFILENGLWKLTNKYSSDDAVLNLLYYVPTLFDGKGQKPTDTNLFLGYEQPTQTSTELQPGDTQYKLHIYYGKTIDPTTFTAKLNKQEISALFTPSPFSDEEVLLQLSTGRNVLVLSVDGESKTGKRQTDSDRLVFDVPE